MVLMEVAEQLLRSLALLLLFSPDDAASTRRLSPLHTAQVKGVVRRRRAASGGTAKRLFLFIYSYHTSSQMTHLS